MPGPEPATLSMTTLCSNFACSSLYFHLLVTYIHIVNPYAHSSHIAYFAMSFLKLNLQYLTDLNLICYIRLLDLDISSLGKPSVRIASLYLRYIHLIKILISYLGYTYPN